MDDRWTRHLEVSGMRGSRELVHLLFFQLTETVATLYRSNNHLVGQ